MSEFFSSQGMKPFDIGLTLEKAEPGSAESGFLEMFPMEANLGERNETTRTWTIGIVGRIAEQKNDISVPSVSLGWHTWRR
jgi:hypothetical protein